MDFDLDSETMEMCDAVTRFARRRLGRDDRATLEDFRGRWALAGQQGLMGTIVPASYGGGGLDAVRAAALMESLGYGSDDAGFCFSVAAHLFACLVPIIRFGTQQQKQRWLPSLCSGEGIAAHAITEPDAGSDALRLRTRAERDGDRYVIHGEKCFITNAPVADVFIVQAVTGPAAGYFGLTSFIVPADAPGLTVGSGYGKVGLRGSPMADVRLDGCTVPADAVLGGEGMGASVFSSSMGWERTCLFALYLGAMRRIIEDTSQYVTERRQFGVPIGTFQAVSHRVVEMKLRFESARLMLYRAACGLARGSDDEVGPSLAKLAVSEAAVQIGLDAVQLHGALGIVDGSAETFLRDALPARVFSGSNDIQRNNIARSLGLSAAAGGRRRRASRHD